MMDDPALEYHLNQKEDMPPERCIDCGGLRMIAKTSAAKWMVFNLDNLIGQTITQWVKEFSPDGLKATCLLFESGGAVEIIALDEGGLYIGELSISEREEAVKFAVQHLDCNDNEMVIVEAYDIIEEAEAGHDRWVKTMSSEALPNGGDDDYDVEYYDDRIPSIFWTSSNLVDHIAKLDTQLTHYTAVVEAAQKYFAYHKPNYHRDACDPEDGCICGLDTLEEALTALEAQDAV